VSCRERSIDSSACDSGNFGQKGSHSASSIHWLPDISAFFLKKMGLPHDFSFDCRTKSVQVLDVADLVGQAVVQQVGDNSWPFQTNAEFPFRSLNWP
jgi:hypothetical protein